MESHYNHKINVLRKCCHNGSMGGASEGGLVSIHSEQRVFLHFEKCFSKKVS